MPLSLLGNIRRALLVLFVACLALSIVGVPACSSSSESSSSQPPSDPTEGFADIAWPTRGLATMLPQPAELFGEITSDRSNHFGVSIGNFTPDQFVAYVAACEETGFTENYSKGKESYFADNLEGYHLRLNYSPDYQCLSISLDAPVEAAENSPEDTATTDSEEPAEPEASNDASDSAATTEKPADGNTMLGEVTPDFKKAMDEYEAFFDEYIAFMKKYENTSDFSPAMLDDFNKYMERYTQTMEALNAIDANSLSPADYAYYTEVVLRINDKIANL